MRLETRERTQSRLSGVLRDESKVVIDGTALTALTWWLYDPDGNIINTRTSVDILNTNGGSVDANGNWALLLTADDQVITGTKRSGEDHIALIKIEWAASNEAWEEIEFFVKNLTRVPTS